MSAVEAQTALRAGHLRRLRAVLASPRFWIYLSCAALAVLANYLLGKEMMWDTRDYHLYAGFSALHHRLGTDYFPAGPQSYFNPYVYVPFYLLASSRLPALLDASVLAAVQSGILWLTYEIALQVAPAWSSRSRMAIGICAALLALVNPILIEQLGSSFTDVTTAEIVLAGWLLLVCALRTPSGPRVITAGLLLGAASALKLTNSLHALSACVLLLFLPTTWRRKTRLSLGFVAALAASFTAVTLPWALRLYRHFGNPVFPLLNNVFRSPDFPAVSVADYRFVPSSFAAALLRPFAIGRPVTMVDDEFASPDIRYAVLLILTLVAVSQWVWWKMRRAPESRTATEGGAARHAFVALGCAFLVDWVLWLRVSGNGRYFLAMACVAGVLSVALACRIFSARRRVAGYLLVAVLAAQGLQLALGTKYRSSAPWDGGAWFEVSLPPALKDRPDLYFLIGEDSESFIAPFLARGSAFVNLAGDYVLGPNGANGARIRSLIKRYAPHIRVVSMASHFKLGLVSRLPGLEHVNDTLAAFGLQADTGDCSTIVVRDIRPRWKKVLPGMLPISLPETEAGVLRLPMSPDGDLVTCRADPAPGSRVALASAEREPNLVFDRMEDECPRLFQPPRPATEAYGDRHSGYLWIRKYLSTNLTALVGHGVLTFVDGTRGGRPDILGRESDWAKGTVPLECGRRGGHYYAKVVSSAH